MESLRSSAMIKRDLRNQITSIESPQNYDKSFRQLKHKSISHF